MNAMAPSNYRRMADVIRETAYEFDLTPGAILERNRARAIAFPRFAAMHVCHKRLGRSLPEIGRFFGMDHTTILNGVRRAEEIRRSDADYDQRLTDIGAKFAKPVFIRDCNKPIFKSRRETK